MKLKNIIPHANIHQRNTNQKVNLLNKSQNLLEKSLKVTKERKAQPIKSLINHKQKKKFKLKMNDKGKKGKGVLSEKSTKVLLKILLD